MKPTRFIFGLVLALLLVIAHNAHAAAAGDACTTPNDPNECGGPDAGLYCDSSLTCQPVSGTHSSVPASYTPAATQNSSNANAQSAAGSSNFVPLTNFPAVTAVADNLGTNGITNFLNNLYKICIGLAATLAVLQIMYAGILWMSAGDSMESVSKARRLIGGALFGLVLVLSPVIVFSFVNPSILNLNLNFSALQVNPKGGTPAPTANSNQSNCKDLIGGCTNAPTSKIDATGETNPGCQPVPNNTIINDPNGAGSQTAACCSHQYSDIAQCGVVAKTNQDMSQTTICACSIKPNIGVDYFVLYTVATSTDFLHGNKSYTKVGTAPYYQTSITKVTNECTAAGGKVTDKETAGLFSSSPYVTCPAQALYQNDPSKTYMCDHRQLTCTSQ